MVPINSPVDLIFVLLIILTLPKFTSSSNLDYSCHSLHARSRGINLACCGGSRHGQLSHTCRFRNTLCKQRFTGCRCLIEVNVPTLECVVRNKTAEFNHLETVNISSENWKDHDEQLLDTFICSAPNFPNSHANFAINIRFSEWNDQKLELFNHFVQGLKIYRVVSMELKVGHSVPKLPSNFFDSFPNLHQLTIQGPGSTPFGAGPMLLSADSLSKLYNLESLTVKYLSYLPASGLFHLEDAANFTQKLRRLHLEGLSRFHGVPAWLSHANQLHYARFKRTKIKDLEPLTKLKTIEYLYAPQNEIDDLRNTEFDVPRLKELDLSNNLIKAISAKTFRKAPSLKFLDLSGNPLQVLPSRVFSRLASLQWLHLKRTRLVHLSAAHVTGLVGLTELSLQGNSHLDLETFSMLPLTALETLDLRDCNLTRLPDAVSQACDLKHLWLNFNQVNELPPEVVLHLNRLEQLVLSENPVFNNPVSLFLLPPRNTKLLSSVLVSLKQLPAWWADSCTPYMWWLHLINGTMTPPAASKIYRKIFPVVPQFQSYDGKRCSRRYYRISSELSQLYQPLLEKTRCETVRRLRSIDLTPPPQIPAIADSQIVTKPSVASSNIAIDQSFGSEWPRETIVAVLLASLLINIVCCIFCVACCALKYVNKLSM